MKNNRTFSVCRENKGMSVVNVFTGKVITTVPIGAGVDAVAYDPELKLISIAYIITINAITMSNSISVNAAARRGTVITYF